jgi:hypothetical protein
MTVLRRLREKRRRNQLQTLCANTAYRLHHLIKKIDLTAPTHGPGRLVELAAPVRDMTRSALEAANRDEPPQFQ